MEHNSNHPSKASKLQPYGRFIAMIVVSAVIMYGLMFSNVYQFDHVFFSQTRLYMTLIMAAWMAIVMLSFMLHMHKSRAANAAIYVASALLFGTALYLVRSQATVDDVSYMKAMIPHHSIAVLTSERAKIADPRVRALADTIIESQQKEIEEMKKLVTELEGKK